MKRSTLAVLTAAALALSACGGDDQPAGSAVAEAVAAGATTTSGATAEAPAPTAAPTTARGSTTAARSVVPAVAVTDLATGQSVELRAQVAPDKPTLLWMWAPH